jgi:hypothetical protein
MNSTSTKIKSYITIAFLKSILAGMSASLKNTADLRQYLSYSFILIQNFPFCKSYSVRLIQLGL